MPLHNHRVTTDIFSTKFKILIPLFMRDPMQVDNFTILSSKTVDFLILDQASDCASSWQRTSSSQQPSSTSMCSVKGNEDPLEPTQTRSKTFDREFVSKMQGTQHRALLILWVVLPRTPHQHFFLLQTHLVPNYQSNKSICFDNVNGYNVISSTLKSSCKHRRLRQLWRKCEVDLIRLVEPHVNLELLPRGKCVKENIFRSDINKKNLTSNTKELIDARQQWRVISSFRGELVDQMKLC